MIRLSGRYEWQLINKDTGLVENSGAQDNLINERFFWTLATQLLYYDYYQATAHGLYFYYRMRIQLSDSTPTPGTEYRSMDVTPGFNLLEQSAEEIPTEDTTIVGAYVDNNFSPPGASRTINVIGVSMRHTTYESSTTYNFISFIELTTPITQQTNQYLFVKYTLKPEVNFRGTYTPNTRYHTWQLNRTLFLTSANALGKPNNSFSYDAPRLLLSPLLEPINKDYLQRNSWFRVNDRTYAGYLTSTNSTISEGSLDQAITFNNEFSVTSGAGPIGSLLIETCNQSATFKVGTYRTFNACLGYSPIPNNDPSISRVFSHPSSRNGQIFSDPAYPAQSEGGVTTSGTPTCKWPMIMRVHITKTGDASDIVDEDVDSSDVNATSDQLAVIQVWGTGDIVRLTTTGALPDPLAIDTDYYVIYIDNTHIQLATTYENADAGIEIDLTNQGTGTHTLIRQNTGEFNIQMDPWLKSNMQVVPQITMAVEANGKMQPHAVQGEDVDDSDWVDVGENLGDGDLVFTSISSGTVTASSLIRSVGVVGDYLYTIQHSRSSRDNLCRWRINTAETSQALFDLDSVAQTTWRRMLVIGTDIYFATGMGVYKYDTTTPATSPQKVTITGLLNDLVQDLAYDEITGYLWSGHNGGLSKIDLNTNSAVAYHGDAGGALEGIDTQELNILPGTLEAHNGRVLRGGSQESLSNYGTGRKPWIMDDASLLADVNFYVLPNLSSQYENYYGVCMEKGTNNIVHFVNRYTNAWTYSSVTTSGKGTGVKTDIRHANSPGNYFNKLWTNLTFITEKLVAVNNEGGLKVEYFNIETGEVSNYDLAVEGSNTISTVNYTGKIAIFAQSKEHLDLGYGQKLFFLFNALYRAPFPQETPYGWDGADWVRNDATTLKIPASTSVSLPYGVSVSFNNATGSPYDRQFVADEDFTFMIAPCMIKDNLQTFEVKSRVYFCDARIVTDLDDTIPASPYQITITESSDTDFKEMDTVSIVTKAYDVAGATYMTLVDNSPAAGEFSVSSDGVFTFNSADTGKSVKLSYVYTLYT